MKDDHLSKGCADIISKVMIYSKCAPYSNKKAFLMGVTLSHGDQSCGPLRPTSRTQSFG